MKTRIAGLCSVAVVLALTAGCSAGTDDASSTTAATTAKSATTAKAGEVPASAETKETFGVDHWSSEESSGNTVVEGTDASGKVHVRFTKTVTTDDDGAIHGAITANIDGSPTFEYAMSASGEGRVVKNDFPQSPDAVAAARAAQADMTNAGTSVNTKSLSPMDVSLVSGGGVKLNAAATCLAVACMVAALCGLGGSAGDDLTAAVIEAGTEQCK